VSGLTGEGGMTDGARVAFVLGHRGMLGHVVARCAGEAGYDVITSDERYRGAPRDALVEHVRESGAGLVVNCLGLTKQRGDDRASLYLANATFPIHVATRLRPTQFLVHASTDCVFAGTRGGYRIDEEYSAVDAYGFSKALGEAVARWPNVTVIRVSVVGPDRANGHGLLEWLLRYTAGRDIPGYTNHRWNGITTLEWAGLALAAADARRRGDPVPRIAQPGTTVITKYELLGTFRDLFAPDRRVAMTDAPEAVDRSLTPSDMRPPIRVQLERMAAWYPLRP
jgi:dTDP-4-dehydrorhamnose reductase